MHSLNWVHYLFFSQIFGSWIYFGLQARAFLFRTTDLFAIIIFFVTGIWTCEILSSFWLARYANH